MCDLNSTDGTRRLAEIDAQEIWVRGRFLTPASISSAYLAQRAGKTVRSLRPCVAFCPLVTTSTHAAHSDAREK